MPQRTTGRSRASSGRSDNLYALYRPTGLSRRSFGRFNTLAAAATKGHGIADAQRNPNPARNPDLP